MTKKRKRGRKKAKPQELNFASLGEVKSQAKKYKKSVAKLKPQEPMVDFFKEIEKPVTVMAYLGEMFVFGAVFSLLPFGLISLICRISSAANQSVDIFLDNSPNAAGVCLLGIILASCLIYAYIHLRIKQYLKAHGIKSLFFEVT